MTIKDKIVFLGMVVLLIFVTLGIIKAIGVSFGFHF